MDPALSLFLTSVVSFLTGVAGTIFLNERDCRRTDAAELLGSYKVYWYNTRNIRNKSHEHVTCASVQIARDWRRRVRVSFTEDLVDEEDYEGYSYEGRLCATESQVHWIMTGRTRSDTLYAVFNKDLSRKITCLAGIFLLTADDGVGKPMAIRCLLSESELEEGEFRKRFGAKTFLTIG